jgi:hypothetical protein
LMKPVSVAASMINCEDRPEACLAHPSDGLGHRASPVGNDHPSHASEASSVVPLYL